VSRAMRDPDLVKRAERAAISLERAWTRWRAAHGLDAGPMPPVSSYVGYSLVEPWGQPRVVFGVGAEEAEKLAALLDGHDCVGPVHAEITSRVGPPRAEIASRPDWRHASPEAPAIAPASAVVDPLGPDTRKPAASAARGDRAASQAGGAASPGHPAVSRDPVADRGYRPDSSRYAAASVASAAPGAVRPAEPQARPAEPEASPAEPQPGPVPAAAARVPSGPAAPPADEDSGWLYGPQSVLELTRSGLPAPVRPGQRDGAEPDTLVSSAVNRAPLSRTFPPAPVLPQARTGRDNGAGGILTGQPAVSAEPAAGQPGIVAFRRRPEAAAEHAAAERSQPAPLAETGADVTPSQGPGYRGPRYQGFPPRYQPGPESEPSSEDQADPAPAGYRGNDPTAYPDPSRPDQLPRFGRPRRGVQPGRDSADWQQGQHAADTAV
jgi:hypothetical protein